MSDAVAGRVGRKVHYGAAYAPMCRIGGSAQPWCASWWEPDVTCVRCGRSLPGISCRLDIGPSIVVWGVYR
jgi:hypothetical protein